MHRLCLMSLVSCSDWAVWRSNWVAYLDVGDSSQYGCNNYFDQAFPLMCFWFADKTLLLLMIGRRS